jgi:hypothetical protein
MKIASRIYFTSNFQLSVHPDPALDAIPSRRVSTCRAADSPSSRTRIGIATGDAADALRQQFFYNRSTLPGLSLIGQEGGQRLGQLQAAITTRWSPGEPCLVQAARAISTPVVPECFVALLDGLISEL